MIEKHTPIKEKVKSCFVDTNAHYYTKGHFTWMATPSICHFTETRTWPIEAKLELLAKCVKKEQ